MILPAENERDLEDIPADVREKMEFNLVESMDEVIPLALDGTIVPLAAKEKLPEPEKIISPRHAGYALKSECGARSGLWPPPRRLRPEPLP